MFYVLDPARNDSYSKFVVRIISSEEIHHVMVYFVAELEKGKA